MEDDDYGFEPECAHCWVCDAPKATPSSSCPARCDDQEDYSALPEWAY